MKRLLSFTSVLFLLVACQPAGPAQSPAGHWEGNITLPGMQLNVRVDLESKGADGWTGTIDIPAQAVRNMKLTGTAVQGDAVSFGMAGVPGDPKFSGKLGGQGKEISGNFTQAGQTFPFKIERKPKPIESTADETPKKGLPGKGLVGFWQGSLKPMAGVELRLVLEITNSPEQNLGGILVSVDQGNARVPMTTLTLEKNVVHFETQSIGGTFEGELSEDGSDMEGDWQQLGRTTPMTFFRLEKAPRSITP